MQFMKFMLSSWGELESVQQPLQACQTAPKAESAGRSASKPVTEGKMHGLSFSPSVICVVSLHSWLSGTSVNLYVQRVKTSIAVAEFCYVCMRVFKSLQSCPALWNVMDCSLQSSSARGIPQARILERVAVSFSRGSS